MSFQEISRRIPTTFWLILLLLLCHLPFLNHAVHIDDRLFLEIAANALKEPFFPHDYHVAFEGLVYSDNASHGHLPLTSYYLALLMSLGIEQEWVYHLAFLVFPALAVWGFFTLSSTYVRSPVLATCLLIVSPNFFTLSHTLMPDVALLAFWLVSLAYFLRITKSGGTRSDWIICILSLLCASFISVLSMGLVLLLTVHWLLVRKDQGPETKPRTGAVAGLLLAPILMWLLWFVVNSMHYGRFVLFNTINFSVQSDTPELMSLKTLSFILDLGGVFIFPPLVWYYLGKKTKVLSLLSIPAVVLVFFILKLDWCWTSSLLFVVFFATGFLVFLNLMVPLTSLGKIRGDQLRLELLLFLWFCGALVICAVVFFNGSVRYSLLALPPVLLVVTRHMGGNSWRSQKFLVGCFVILTGGYSLIIASADYEFASVYRRAVEEIQRDYARPSRSIWFSAEWGLRYYLEKSGAKLLPQGVVGPEPGDIIVKSQLATPWPTLYDSPVYSRQIALYPVVLESPLRILDSASRAGFYSTGWGILPFAFKCSDCGDQLEIFEVHKEYDGPPVGPLEIRPLP